MGSIGVTSGKGCIEAVVRQATRTKVLVVDDDPSTLKLYERVIGAHGYEVSACSSAEEAWSVYQESFHPLVVLDWLMPGMDGLSFCRKLREESAGKKSVILVVTSCDQPEHLNEVLAAGADDYLPKPVNAAVLGVRLAIATQHAEIKRSHLSIEERLRQARDRLETTLSSVERAKREWESTADSLSELVCLLNRQGLIIRANMAVEFWGLRDVVHVKGTAFHDLLHPECNDPTCYLRSLWHRVLEVLDKGRPMEWEVEDPCMDRYLHMQFRPVQAFKTECGESSPTESFAVAVIQDITDRKRMELELKRAREQEMSIGSKIQQALLVDVPPEDLNDIEVAALTIPSEHIDGDFYSFFKHSDQCIDVVVGDVMGKGVPAALISAAVKSHLLAGMSHLVASSEGGRIPDPDEMVAYVHEKMARRLIGLESFVTLCYTRLDLEKRQAVFVNCGHTRTLHYNQRLKYCRRLDGRNVPLGFKESESYHKVYEPFEQGDVFLFYSDGVIEARDGIEIDNAGRGRGPLFGEDRLARFICSNSDATPAVLAEKVRQAVADYSGSEVFTDDLTCIAVKIREQKQVLLHEELEIRSDLSELRQVRAFLRSFLSCYGPAILDDRSVTELELALSEAVTNVMKHAYYGRIGKPILITADLTHKEVLVKIEHRGEDFDVGSVPLPQFDGTRESGFGLFIMQKCVDGLTQKRYDDGRVSITLVKKRDRA